jgi:hypothetical protein
MGLGVTALQSAQIGLLFVGVSLVRSYILRRVFARLTRNVRPAAVTHDARARTG